MKELMLDASVENIPVVTDFVDEQLKEYGCPMEVRRQIQRNAARCAFNDLEM